MTTLTSREHDILAAVARGRVNDEIAATLALSERTVRNYVSRIYEKIGVTNRVQAALWWSERAECACARGDHRGPA